MRLYCILETALSHRWLVKRFRVSDQQTVFLEPAQRLNDILRVLLDAAVEHQGGYVLGGVSVEEACPEEGVHVLECPVIARNVGWGGWALGGLDRHGHDEGE